MFKWRNLHCPGLIILLLMFSVKAHAQEFGANPPSVKWKQVNTPEVKVIFPKGMDSAGRRVANVIHTISGNIQPSIGVKLKPISVVLQNQTTVSNAYVGLAPFRSEFYLTPEQNSFEIGSLNWIDQLAIHEYRHVQQYNNFNVGVSKAMHVLFGEGGQAFANLLAVPNWFFEGDAVYNETLVSKQGRGRIPYFFNGYRALWATGEHYSYMKLRNGSYRDYIPDHYQLGYMLVSYGREKYGDAFWKTTAGNAAAYKSILFPFQNSFKKTAGIDFNTFRKQTFQSFKQTFNDKPEPATDKHQHFIADCEYPVYIGNDTLVYVKSTYNKRTTFVIKTANKEQSIRVKDISLNNYFAYHDGKIVYAAYHPDARWGYRDYSELRLLDVHTGKQTGLTHRTKYFSPDFSANGSKIITVNIKSSGRSQICILDAVTGKLLDSVPNPQNLFITYPKFYDEGHAVAAVRDAAGYMSMALITLKDGSVKKLFTSNHQPVGFPTLHNDTLYFTATSGKRDELYALSVSNNKLYRLDNDSLKNSIGNYQPAVSNNKLAWVSFTAYGYKIHEADKTQLQWLPESSDAPFKALSDMGISALESNNATNLLAKTNDNDLAVSKYKKSYHLFNFHSLIPEFNDPNYTFSLVSENVLNTLQSNLLFNYNRDEGYKEFGFGGVYGALFPYLNASVNYVIDRRAYYNGGNVYWNEAEVHVGARVPLNFTNGRHITGLSFGTNVVYNSTHFQSAYRAQFADRNYTYLDNFISFSNRISQPKQNIYPRLGQSIYLNYKTAINGTTAHQFLVSGNLYLPGLLINHNLVLNAAYQQKNKNSVISFSNDFPFSRGYQAENLYQLEKFGVNYHFPIAYPDAGFANTLYLLRLRGNVFFDYTHVNDFFINGGAFKANFRTIGAEIYFDTQWFNEVPITFGLRYSHLLDNDVFGGFGNNRIELIVPLTLF